MRKLFTEEQLAFIKENIRGRPYAEMAELINARFGTCVTASQVSGVASHAGWSNGRDTRFPSLPVGSEKLSNNYIYIKIAPGIWRTKNSLVWESIHGPIPPGHAVAFGDGDRRNFAPDNLVLIPQKAVAIMNKRGLFGGSAELTRTGVAVAAIHLAIADRRKKGI